MALPKSQPLPFAQFAEWAARDYLQWMKWAMIAAFASLFAMTNLLAQEPAASAPPQGVPLDQALIPPSPSPSAAVPSPTPVLSTPAASPNPSASLAPMPPPQDATSPLPSASPTASVSRALPAAPPKPVKRKPKPLIALPNYDQDTSVRLQIFLDNNDFGPGKIDGRMGEFFRKALVNYKIAHGLLPTGSVARFLDEVPTPYTTYTIRPEDEKFVGATASKPSQQAKLKALLYGSLLEFVAERFHSAEDFLRTLNPGKNLEQLKVGDTVKVPNVLPFEVEKLSEGFRPKNPALAKRVLIIDTVERTLEVRENNYLLYEFPITPGSTKLPAPKGTWKILGIATLPWFRHDEGVLNHGVRTNNFYNLPPGPNNPVGILWMGLNKPGIGVHGTNNPETIGRAGSHGCIRMANWDAARVRDMVSPGTVVQIY